MSILICEGKVVGSIDHKFNLVKKVFEKVLPDTETWRIEYSPSSGYFDCITRIDMEEPRGYLGMFIRFEILEDLSLAVTKIGGSRKESSPNWSGTAYGKQRDDVQKKEVKSWVLFMKSKGVVIFSDVIGQIT
jgi:hypothetical protein